MKEILRVSIAIRKNAIARYKVEENFVKYELETPKLNVLVNIFGVTKKER